MKRFESVEDAIKDSLDRFDFTSSEKEIVEKAQSKSKSFSLRSLIYKSRYAYAAVLVLILLASAYFFSGIGGSGNLVPAGSSKDKLEIYLYQFETKEGAIGLTKDMNLYKTPVLTLEDIEYCVWEGSESGINVPGGQGSSSLLLKLRKNSDILKRINELSPLGVKYKSFVLKINDESIFKGAFYSAISSLSPPSDVYVLFEVMSGSHNGEYFLVETGSKNILHDKRLYDVLDRNGLIKNTNAK
jgi:hypothetical protein